jgi:outer membrane protein assembly factor BamB
MSRLRLLTQIFSPRFRARRPSAILPGFWLLLTGCGPASQLVVPPWNQFHGDVANSGQVLTGTKPAKELGVVSGQVGRMEFSSPVLAPDGSVWIGTFGSGGGADASALVRLSVGSGVTVVDRKPLGGQLSTPAVDAAGNVYVAQFLPQQPGSHLLSFGPGGEARWDIPLVNGRALAPPKVLAVPGGSLIFLPYTGGRTAGGHVLVVNDQGTILRDQLACNVIVGGYGLPGFRVDGIDLGPPYPEDPAVAIRLLQSERGAQHYLVVATNRCSLTFFRLDLGATAADKPTLTSFNYHETDADAYSAPAIGADGTVVIADSDRRVTAYDLATGERKWDYQTDAFVSTTPTLLPLAINFVYVASYNLLAKLDLATGQVVGQIGVIGPVDASPAAGGENILISTTSGVFTYDLDLHLKAFTPLAGGRSSPAIDATGRVYVASTDGMFSVFPGP